MIGTEPEKSRKPLSGRAGDGQHGGSAVTRPADPPAPASIRERRLAVGMPQKQLAFLAGVSLCALSYAERGMRWHCGPAAVAKIEAALAAILEARA